MKKMSMRLVDYQEEATRNTPLCRWCKAPLPAKIECYPHTDGWTVDGYTEKQWLYITCNKCKYEWSLWKLGVMRE